MHTSRVYVEITVKGGSATMLKRVNVTLPEETKILTRGGPGYTRYDQARAIRE